MGMVNNTSPLRACLHGGGGPQVGEVTRLGGVTRLSIPPRKGVKKDFNEELEKSVEDKNSINISTSTQFAPHTWQIIDLKKAMLLTVRF